MKIKDLKQYTVFLIIIGLFMITVATSAIIYLKWTNKIDGKSIEQKISLEINLPVIEWGKYEVLSKKALNDKIK